MTIVERFQLFTFIVTNSHVIDVVEIAGLFLKQI